MKYEATHTFPDGTKVPLILDKGKRKSIRIEIRSGQLIVRMPDYADMDSVIKFLNQKQDWIMQSLAQSSDRVRTPKSLDIGDIVTIAGESYIITSAPSDKYFKPYFKGGRLCIAAGGYEDSEYIRRQAQEAIYEKGFEILKSSMQRLSKKMNLYPKKVTIKHMNSRWGSCSSQGNISLNFNLIYYEQEHIDYVIIHELSHLVHMNHSADFWNLVSQYCPNYKALRNEMKE